MREIWRDIKGYEGLYQASNLGNVKSLDKYTNSKCGSKRFVKGKIIKLINHQTGYLVVTLCKDGKGKSYKVHRLVAEAFIPNPQNLEIVNHKDEDKHNNKVENLEWCDYKYNINYGTGLKRRAKSQSIPINQYSLEGEFIKSWDGVSEVARQLGYSAGYICLCCQGKRKSAYGFLWKYAN